MEEKTNGNGGMGHKIDEEAAAEAAFQKMKIGDLCPVRSERLLLCAAKLRW
jgi:hypothetical protein